MTGAEVTAYAGSTGHGLAGVADAGAFLARLVRFDPAALVRLRSDGPAGPTTLWARLPWTVLVARTVPGPGPGDATVSAADLLTELGRGGTTLPPRQDAQWRWPLPSASGRTVETLPGDELRRIADAAAATLRTASAHGVAGRAVGQRAVRDALLDHVAVVVTAEPGQERVEVPQRLVQGVVRMGFLGPSDGTPPGSVQVRMANRWVGLRTPFGVAWLQKVTDLAVKRAADHPNG